MRDSDYAFGDNALARSDAVLAESRARANGAKSPPMPPASA